MAKTPITQFIHDPALHNAVVAAAREHVASDPVVSAAEAASREASAAAREAGRRAMRTARPNTRG